MPSPARADLRLRRFGARSRSFVTAQTILQHLIAIDSQNPPGNEQAVVDYLSSLCDRFGLAYSTYTYGEGRGNIVIRLAPERSDRLIFLGHLDVVRANAESWEYDPFSGEIADGCIHGRGALDMKYFVAVVMAVLGELAQGQNDLDRGITAVFTADEEAGSTFGLPRLIEEPGLREEFSGRTVLNEGGGFAYRTNGTWFSLVETGQKTVCRVRITVPELPDTNPYFPTLSHEAILVRAIAAVQGTPLPRTIPVTATVLVRTILGDHTPATTPEEIDSAIAHLEASGEEFLSRLLFAMTHNMLTPTIVRGGSRNPALAPNVKATVDFDCRLLPGLSEREFVGAVERAIAALPVELSVLSFSQGYESTGDLAIFKRAEEAVRRHDPEIAACVPFLTPGANDGRYLRPLGSEVLGFAPLDRSQPFVDVISRIHGDNERISVSALTFCHAVIADVSRRYVQGEESERQE